MVRVHGISLPTPQSYARQFWQHEGTVVAGSWAWFPNANETDYSSVQGEGAGGWQNSGTNANLDEYKWSSVFLSIGTYKITLIYEATTNRGIAELLFGTVSLATLDMYNAGDTFNNVWTVTFIITIPTQSDLRFRSNGKNGASTNYNVNFSRFQLEKIS